MKRECKIRFQNWVYFTSYSNSDAKFPPDILDLCLDFINYIVEKVDSYI